ncbi:MAG: hypothetical protein AAGL98_12910 [Planctomycetota bacterium]
MSEQPPIQPTSVRLDDGQWNELFQNIDLAEQMIPGRERREFDRFDFDAQVTLYAEFDEPAVEEIPEPTAEDRLAEQLAAICAGPPSAVPTTSEDPNPSPEPAAQTGAEEKAAPQDPGPVFQRYLVRTRNVSASGLGFIHHTEVVVGTRALFTAFDKNGQAIALAGVSARADLIEEGVWDIGIQFNQHIDPTQLVDVAGQPLAVAG